jgi:hypothetical protein
MRYKGHGLTIHVSFYGQMCVLYGPWIQWLFVTGATLMGGHYRTVIISNVDHPRSDSVVSLVLCTVACNNWGTGIVLQVPRDSANPAENE